MVALGTPTDIAEKGGSTTSANIVFSLTETLSPDRCDGGGTGTGKGGETDDGQFFSDTISSCGGTGCKEGTESPFRFSSLTEGVASNGDKRIKVSLSVEVSQLC